MKYLSCVKVEVLLSCYARPNPMTLTPAVKEAVVFWVNNECLTPGDNWFRTTQKGEAMVEAILRTPMPKACFLLPDGEVYETT